MPIVGTETPYKGARCYTESRMKEKQAVARIREADLAMRDYKEKVYRLRRIVAGDVDALYSKSVSNNQDRGKTSARQFSDTHPPILLQQFEEGRNNDLLLLIGVLVEQTCYYFPKIEVQNLTPHQQVAQSRYISDRLTACNAIHHNKIALWDHLMGGCGDIYICMENGYPVVRWADSLDIKFDQTARLVCDVRWKSHTVCHPLRVWLETFPDSAVLKKFAETNTKAGRGTWEVDDIPIDLEFYYTMDGEKGDYMVFQKTAESDWNEDAVFADTNPNFFDIYGERVPFLPYESIFYTALPSVRLPIGASEKALPAQIAVWRAAKRIQTIIDNGPGFYEILKGMSAEEKKQFIEAMLTGVVEVDESSFGRINKHEPIEIRQTDVEELNRNQQALKTQLGASSYSLGQPEQGVKYAREVSAIQAEGSLTAGSISKDNSDFWGRWVPKFVRRGQLHDTKIFVTHIDGIEYVFDKSDPVGDYLVPNATLKIAEDSMRFVPQQIKVAQAKGVLDTAVSLSNAYPGAIAPAYRMYLEANGVEGIEEWLKQPAVLPVPGGAPMAGASTEQPMSAGMSVEAGTGA